MDGEGHSGKKGKIPTSVWIGLVLIVGGIIVGAYLAPVLDPFIHPDRAALVERAQSIQTQNGLLKAQIDCLVNGLNQNKGEAAVAECT